MYTAVSSLTTIPTLCMGIFALTIPTITNRIGRERGVFWGVVLITGATAVRVGSQHALVLFGSTILVGIGIHLSGNRDCCHAGASPIPCHGILR